MPHVNLPTDDYAKPRSRVKWIVMSYYLMALILVLGCAVEYGFIGFLIACPLVFLASLVHAIAGVMYAVLDIANNTRK